MKNKRGFTLIELIGIIVIIAIISMIAIKTVTSKIEKSTEKAYNIQINNIIQATKKYMLENETEDKYHLNTMCITIKNLQDKGYLEKGNIKNPKTSQNFDVDKNYVKVKYNIEKNQYEYNFTDNCVYDIVTPASETILENTTLKIINKDDGLYETTDSYVYRGLNPNNYFEFHNEQWRIVSIDKETMMLKLINLKFNPKTITEEGILKDLNNDFETGTTYSGVKEFINLNSKWNYGMISKLDSSQTLKSLEKQSSSFNTISLLTVSEYIDASLEKNCYVNNTCNSYLSKGLNYLLLNSTNDNKNWYVTNKNELATTTIGTQEFHIYPCIYLKLNTQIKGTGTIDSPYEIK